VGYILGRRFYRRRLTALEGLGRKLTPESGFVIVDSGHFTEMSGNFQICAPQGIGPPADNPVENEILYKFL
jgi:hypothetical protein